VASRFCVSRSSEHLIVAVAWLCMSCTAAGQGRKLLLSRKTKPNSKNGLKATKRSITSAGETFADGAMIELVSGSSGFDKPDFLLWKGRKTTIGPHVEHGGCIHEVPELASSLYRATRLPSRCTDYGSGRRL